MPVQICRAPIRDVVRVYGIDGTGESVNTQAGADSDSDAGVRAADPAFFDRLLP